MDIESEEQLVFKGLYTKPLYLDPIIDDATLEELASRVRPSIKPEVEVKPPTEAAAKPTI